MSEPTEKPNLFSRDRVHTFIWAFALVAVGWVASPIVSAWVSAKPNLSALCSRSVLSIPAYSQGYVNPLREEFDKRGRELNNADYLAAAVNRAKQISPDRQNLADLQADLAAAMERYKSTGPLVQFPSYDTNTLVAGEVRCLVKNDSTSKVATEIEVTMPTQPIAMFVSGKPVSFDAQTPIYKLASLNPNTSFSIVTQYGEFRRIDSDAAIPVVTFADGVGTVEVEQSVSGTAATMARMATLGGLAQLVLIVLVSGILASFLSSYLAYRKRARTWEENQSKK